MRLLYNIFRAGKENHTPVKMALLLAGSKYCDFSLGFIISAAATNFFYLIALFCKIYTLTVSCQFFSISTWSAVRWSGNFQSSKKHVILCVMTVSRNFRPSDETVHLNPRCLNVTVPSYKLCSHGISFVSACESSGNWAQVSTVLGKYVGHRSVLLEMRLSITVRRMVFHLFRLTLPGLIVPKFHFRMWQLDCPGCCSTMYILA